MALFLLGYLYKHPFSKYRLILRYGGLGHHQMDLEEDTIQPIALSHW